MQGPVVRVEREAVNRVDNYKGLRLVTWPVSDYRAYGWILGCRLYGTFIMEK